MPDSKDDQAASTTQHQRFITAARALGADEDEAAFKAKLAAIARQTVFAEGIQHASDCAVHNAPAYPPGRCTCGVATVAR